MINKDLVKFRFQKSINTYDNCAVIQKEMAHLLIEKILANCGNSFDKVFEFGAGTGFLSKICSTVYLLKSTAQTIS